jgi:hypothetical protein
MSGLLSSLPPSVAAGAPNLLGAAAPFVPQQAVMVADALGLPRLIGGAAWGIFTQTGQPVVTPDTFVSLDYAADWRVSDYPIEGGKLLSYNKVAQPYGLKVVIAIGGSFNLLAAAQGLVGAIEAGSFTQAFGALTGEGARTGFLAALDAAANSMALLNVVTPTKTYESVSIVHIGYGRSQREGATLLSVEVWFQQVRIAPDPAFTTRSTASPNGAPEQDNGVGQVSPYPTKEIIPVSSAPLPAPT